MTLSRGPLLASLACSLGLTLSGPALAEPFDFKPGDRVALIGNTLADRMQHDGWLETYFHTRFPKHDLVFRNLGFPGDEVGGFTATPDANKRLRSAAFGSNDEWLRRVKANVVFAFFGYNESFAGEAGLAKFKDDLTSFIKHTTAQKYNGESAPRIVLFCPVAHENLKDSNLPDGTENNKRLELYTAAMAEVAKANGVTFVDLFHPTRDLYAKAAEPLTINGVHLNAKGNELVAKEIDRALFAGAPEPKRETVTMDRIRRTVVDRNFHWFERYRTTDGYSIYGGRADLKFVKGQTNREVAEREMEVLDVMTANRDKRVWAVAQGGDLEVNDDNTSPFIPVETNKPGPLQGGKHLFLDPEDAIKHMKVAPGLKVNLFASEKEFPELVNPVQMAWDTKGRLWVAVWPTYPHWKPKEEMNDKLLIFEDTDGDGKADKMTVFADHLSNPTGFEFYNGGVLVAQAPNVVFLKDTNGDDRADQRITVIGGVDSADTHHTSNSFTLDPGGALYFQEGTFHHTQVETPYSAPVRCANAGVFRYEPRTQKFDVYVTYGFANPHGHVFDRWGQDIVVDGTGAVPYHAALFSGHLDFPNKHRQPPTVYKQWTRPCPGMEYLSSRHFPESMNGNLLVANVIGYQGILQYKITDQGASFSGEEKDRLLSSDDPNFRPTDVKVGPDGAIYFVDWHNPIIGHMQHNLRDPSRDREHGRIYRIVAEGRPLLKPEKIAGEPIEKLFDLLKSPEDRVRCRARIELSGRPTADVIAAAKKWASSLPRRDKLIDEESEHARLEVLWLHQSHNVVDQDLLKQVLASPDFRARAAATRVLCYWRDRVPDALELLKKLAADEAPRVRLEAVRAASFFTVPEAVEIPLIAEGRPQDEYIAFVRAETMRALDPYVKKAIAAGKTIDFTTPAGGRYFLKNVGTDDLLRMKRSPGVYLELLFRPGVRDEFRREALVGLAAAEKKSELKVLLDAIRQHDAQSGTDESVAFDLVRLLTDRPAQLADVRADLEALALKAKAPVTRQLGWVSLIAADGGPDRAWALAIKSVTTLKDLVNAMPLIRDVAHRIALYPKIVPLLDGLPSDLAAGQPKSSAVVGRYVRIELPGKQRTLTLAEVEVFSDGRNAARRGRAKQSSTAYGGNAAHAIDGNTSGNFADGGQTHSREGEDDPWWEVDLRAEYPIERIVVYNRTDGNLGSRLNNFTVRVLDATRRGTFEKTNNPAPQVKAEITLGAESPERVIRRAAMLGLTSVRGKEAATFQALARFVKDDAERHPAITALLRIPASEWPKEDARPLLETIVGSLRKLPVGERTTPAALDAVQFAESLTGLLPVEEGRKVRRELAEVGVRVLRVGTVTDQMLFDKERLAVQAGKPVEFVFENTDIMPHNFVIVQPGALEEIGNAAEAGATQPGALERHYVPQSNKLLLSSKLLQPRDVQRLSYTAPTTPGIYPYVCTYPGHWRRMYGALYVVADLEDYLTDPEGYLAKHPLPVKDELLKFNRPRKEWKFEDLAAEVEKMKDGRSFATARQIYTVASCVSCHKMNGVGQELGPDLTKLDPKIDKPTEILRHILEPSLRIEDKYQTWVFDLSSGKKVTGMILEQKGGVYKVIENPLLKAEPVLINESDIETKTKSATSIMPKGLLDKLTKEEILDLIAYIAAKGEAKHALFQGGHDHKNH
ncbi:MAG TPA: PVC-type heme-binding CxxCH protein [Gemmataceae bacterium]|nr:PVC-type heme-binding CxxCH protein [Gemmataceae bacterium]